MKLICHLLFLALASISIASTPPPVINKTCPASQWINTIVPGQQPTCTQPSYSNISGTPPTFEWGQIGGILSNQTDLQNALDGKQPVLGYTPLNRTQNLNDVQNKNSALNNILPTQTGNNGKTLTTNGSTSSWTALAPAVWGTIIGTLSNQTDLQAALGAKQNLITAGTTFQYWRGDKTFQTLDTSVVPENSNLYFTQGRARNSLSGVLPLTYDSTTGAFSTSVSAMRLLGNSGVSTSTAGEISIGSGLSLTGSVLSVTGSGGTGVNSVTASAPVASSGGSNPNISMPQGTSTVDGYLFHTDWVTFNSKQAAGNYVTALTGDVTASGPGSVAATLATVNSNVGSFTSANITVDAKGRITAAANGSGGGGSVTGVTASSPLFSSGGTTPNITVQQSSGTQDGYLSSVDWLTFNGKQAALSFGNLTDAGTDGITVTSGTGAVIGSGTSLAQHVSDTTHNGYLSSTDWATFNGKQNTLTLGNLTSGTTGVSISGGTGAVVGSGAAVSVQTASGSQPGLLSAADWTTFNGKQASGNYLTDLTGDGTASGPGSGALTLSTVNSNVGSFTNANVTVNAKGLITAASNGSGGGGTPGGTSGQVQYNNSGAFGGFGSWNGTTLAITGAISSTTTVAVGTNLHVFGTSILAGDLAVQGGANFSGNLGFYGASEIAQPSGNVITALSGLGLIATPTISLSSGITGTLQAAQFPALTGDVTTTSGALATTIAANAVTNAKAAQMAGNTIKGNNTGSTANAADLTVAQVQAMILPPTIFGTRASPRSIVAATGITSGASHMSTTALVQKIYVQGSVAGDSVAATITAGTIDGQVMCVNGRLDANTVSLTSATTNVVVAGTVTLGADDIWCASFDGTNWVETNRSIK